MKKLVVVFGIITFSTFAYSQENEDFSFDEFSSESETELLPKAPSDTLNSAKELCKSWATEDEVTGDQLASYMMRCVNEELEYQGYSPVASID